MKKRIEKISYLIDIWCKKKLFLACPLLPFGIVEKVYPHCKHLQIALADTQTEICKRVQFSPSYNAIL
ncbi:MAG: hypothetical protein R6U95_06750, partial [Bacteroidales bacterium]